MGGSTTYSLNNGILNVSGNWFIAYQVNVKENTDYYISADREIISGTASGNISIYNSAVTTVIKNGARNNFTFNSGNNTVISVVLYSGHGSAGEVNFSNIMLNIGTTEKRYSPYVSNPIELCKIRNYKDSIFKAITGNPKYDSLDNTTKESLTYGNWYIEKNIGKIILNGSESGWTFTTNGNAWFISGWASSNNAKTPANNDTLSGSISNYFTNVTRNQLANVTQGIGIASSGAINLKHPDYTTSGSQLSSFTTWLSNNNPIMYYILANPTYEIITNTNLIEQLNNLQDITLIENLCYVDWVGVEKPDMTLQYPTNETLNAYITTEDNKLIRTDWGV